MKESRGAIDFQRRNRAQDEGNVDIYLVPSEGGVPRRLTWHPVGDAVRCFSPDGPRVYFTSNRNSANSPKTLVRPPYPVRVR